MKGVAMSAGREQAKELYVGFLLLLLSFLYLSHLTAELRQAVFTEEASHAKRPAHTMARAVATEKTTLL